MIETITPAVCGSRRRQRVALALFTVGAVSAAMFVGGFLGVIGSVLGAERGVVAVVALALVAAAREWGLIRVPLPQSRRQVPERWRAVLPLPVWSFGYGAGLGVGVATFQPVATFWIACAAAVALARPLPAALCFSLYGVGRALLVAWPRGDGAHATDVVERIAARRRALARANAVALVVCAALLIAPSTALGATQIGTGFDPSLSGTTIARARVVSGAPRIVIQPAGEPAVEVLGASSPSVDGDLVAYQETGAIRVVNWRTGATVEQVAGAVSKPALAWPLLVYRRADADYERLILENLVDGTMRTVIRVPLADELGRPSLKGGYVAWHRSGRWGSELSMRRLSTWSKSTIAKSKISLHMHPAVTGWRVVWVELRSGKAYVRMRRHGAARLHTLWSLNRRDLSYWTTALEGRTAIVTRWTIATGGARLFRIRF